MKTLKELENRIDELISKGQTALSKARKLHATMNPSAPEQEWSEVRAASLSFIESTLGGSIVIMKNSNQAHKLPTSRM
jgi:hypothetical protein